MTLVVNVESDSIEVCMYHDVGLWILGTRFSDGYWRTEQGLVFVPFPRLQTLFNFGEDYNFSFKCLSDSGDES